MNCVNCKCELVHRNNITTFRINREDYRCNTCFKADSKRRNQLLQIGYCEQRKLARAAKAVPRGKPKTSVSISTETWSWDHLAPRLRPMFTDRVKNALAQPTEPKVFDVVKKRWVSE